MPPKTPFYKKNWKCGSWERLLWRGFLWKTCTRIPCLYPHNENSLRVMSQGPKCFPKLGTVDSVGPQPGNLEDKRQMMNWFRGGSKERAVALLGRLALSELARTWINTCFLRTICGPHGRESEPGALFRSYQKGLPERIMEPQYQELTWSGPLENQTKWRKSRWKKKMHIK